MREILASIIAVEKDARSRVEEAQKKAAEIKAKADAEADAILARAREDAALLSRRKLEEARTQADSILQDGRKRLQEANRANHEQARPALDSAAVKCAELVFSSVLDGQQA